jgi:hypothetical protein
LENQSTWLNNRLSDAWRELYRTRKLADRYRFSSNRETVAMLDNDVKQAEIALGYAQHYFTDGKDVRPRARRALSESDQAITQQP